MGVLRLNFSLPILRKSFSGSKPVSAPLLLYLSSLLGSHPLQQEIRFFKNSKIIIIFVLGSIAWIRRGASLEISHQENYIQSVYTSRIVGIALAGAAQTYRRSAFKISDHERHVKSI